MELLKFITLI